MADRAVRWLEEVIAGHGTSEGPGRVQIPLSQAALARATARSAGTVSYYLRCLGPLVERRDGALVVDVVALAERRTERRQRRAQVAERLTRRFGQVTADSSAIELVHGAAAPTVREMAAGLGLAPSSVQRHLRALQGDGRAARDGRRLTLAAEDSDKVASTPVVSVVAGLSAAVASLAETASRLTDLAQQLLALAQSDTGPAKICAPQFAHEDPICAPKFADLAREERTQPSSQEKERKLSVFSNKSPRDFAREPSPDFAGSLSRDQLDALLAPLSEACRRYGNKPGFLDDNGRYLSRLSEDQLRAGVDQVIGKLRANTAIDRPFGLLVARAKAGDGEFFAPPPPPTPPPAPPEAATAEPEQTDPDAEAALDDVVAALPPAELEALDAEIAASLSPATLERLRSRPAQLTRLRRLAWQRHHTSEPKEP